MVEPAFDPSKCGFEYIERLESFEFISDCSITESPDPISECVPTTVLPPDPLQPPITGKNGAEGPQGPTGPAGAAGGIGPTPSVTYGVDYTVVGWAAGSATFTYEYDAEDDYTYLLWSFTIGYNLQPGLCCVWRANQAGTPNTWKLLLGGEDCDCGDAVDLDAVADGANACTPSSSEATCVGDVGVVCIE